MNGNNQSVKHLYSYSSTKNNGVVMGTSEFPILRNDIDMKNAKLDLAKGYYSNLPQEYSEKYSSVYDAMIKSKSPGTTLRNALGGPEIVGWIGILEDLTLLGLNKFRGQTYRVRAQKHNGVIFLEKHLSRHNSKSPGEFKYMSQDEYMSHHLKHCMTTAPDGSIKNDELVDTTQGFYNAQTMDFSDGGHFIRFFYVSTVDALKEKDSKEFVVIKTHKGTMDPTFYVEKGIQYWTRCYFGGIKEMVIGLKKYNAIDGSQTKVDVIQITDDGKLKNEYAGKLKDECAGKLKDECIIDTDKVMKYIAKVFIRLNSQFDDPNVTSIDMLVGKDGGNGTKIVDFEPSSSNFIPLPEKFIAAFPKED
uniref:Decapping nuclease n=1 Tax=Rhabditophanes sp. KR3021 TaxID=114890 RepID=A0AC35U3L3_9BILA